MILDVDQDEKLLFRCTFIDQGPDEIIPRLAICLIFAAFLPGCFSRIISIA
jgi:hypothetical protein